MEAAETVPGFWRISLTDAYLFKLCCFFIPAMLLLMAATAVSGRPAEDFRIPLIITALLALGVYYRWSVIRSIFKQHSSAQCSIGEISTGGGLLGLQVYVSFICSFDGESALRGCFLNRFSPRVKRLEKGSAVTVLYNEKAGSLVIKEAYLD